MTSDPGTLLRIAVLGSSFLKKPRPCPASLLGDRLRHVRNDYRVPFIAGFVWPAAQRNGIRGVTIEAFWMVPCFLIENRSAAYFGCTNVDLGHQASFEAIFKVA